MVRWAVVPTVALALTAGPTAPATPAAPHRRGPLEGSALAPEWAHLSRGGVVQAVKAAAAAACVALGLGVGAPGVAVAENELAALGSKGFDSSLIDTACFTSQCQIPAQNCLESGDCRKGMTCTAKCLGDNECITGCFAKYGNAAMNDLLECSVEKHGCIKIAILEGGPDTPATAPAPPVALASTLDPATMDGTWYKVMGWNSRYDCFDCQRNTFTPETKDLGLKGLRLPPSKRQFDVDVEFSMPRPPRGLFESGEPTAYSLRLSEKLVFDDFAARDTKHPQVLTRFHRDARPPAANAAEDAASSMSSSSSPWTTTTTAAAAPHQSHLRRHASTVGHMFGLTFWENWSVIGESAPGEAPFKFVYYTGRTTQNTYDGAFVYAREPTLPESARQRVYAIARTAGLEPNNFCLIRNDCETCSSTFAQADAEKEARGRAKSKGLFMGAAQADDELTLLTPTAAERPRDSKIPRWLESALIDAGDYLENPHHTSKWLFAQQVKNSADPMLNDDGGASNPTR